MNEDTTAVETIHIITAMLQDFFLIFFKKNYGENVNVSATLHCQMFNYLGDNYGSAGFFLKKLFFLEFTKEFLRMLNIYECENFFFGG